MKRRICSPLIVLTLCLTLTCAFGEQIGPPGGGGVAACSGDINAGCSQVTGIGHVTTGTLPAANGGAGTVSGILKANGSGTVSAASSGTDCAPATSGTAILKGNNAGSFSNATSGTDYAPATSGSALLYGNGSGGFSNVTVGSNLNFTGGLLTATGGSGPAIALQFGSTSQSLSSTAPMSGQNLQYDGSHISGITNTAGGAIGGTTANRPGPDGVFNVVNYGAVGNSTTDDGPAIRAAIAAMPGGLGTPNGTGAILYFPPYINGHAANYYLDSNSNSQGVYGPYAHDCAIELNRPMTAYAYGATFTFGDDYGPHPGWCPNGTIHGQPMVDNPYPTWPKAINLPVADGSPTITTTTASDAGSFTAGDWIWVTGGDTLDGDQFADVVTHVDATTGIITLKYPVPKPLVVPTGSGCSVVSSCSKGPGVYLATNNFVFNVNWFGGTFIHTGSTLSGDWEVSMCANCYFKDMTGFFTGPSSPSLETGMLEDVTFENIYAETTGSEGSALGIALDSSRVLFKNNTAIHDIAGKTVSETMGLEEGSDHITFQGNTIVDYGCPSTAQGAVAIGGGAPNLVMDSNKIYQLYPSYACGAAVNLTCEASGWGAMNACITTFTNNYIYTGGNIGVQDGPGTLLRMSNNTIYVADLAKSGNGAALSIGNEPDQVNGNYVYGEDGIILSYPGVVATLGPNTGLMIIGNFIDAYGTTSSGVGIFVGDPGRSGANPDATVLGNTIISPRGTGYCLQFSSLAHSANFKTGAASVSNSPGGIGLNQCATSFNQ